MSYEQRKEEHLYHAFALGAGGYIERDRKKVPIPIAAPNALSVWGGSGETRQKGYEFVFKDPKTKRGADFHMTIGEVLTEVAATELEDRWMTFARSELRNVNINGVVKADLVRGVLNSTHMKRKSMRQKKLEAPVSARGSEFQNLTVNGISVRVALDETIETHATREKLWKFLNGKKKDCEIFRLHNFLGKSEKKAAYVADMERFNNASHFRCSIFGEVALEGKSDAVTACGYSMDIKDFGRLYIGEIIVSHGSKRLNMLRFDLGCDNCGGGTGGSADVNGETMP
jgi:hypothetical protein